MQHFDAAATREALPFAPLVQALRVMFIAGCIVPPRHVHALADANGAPIGTVLVMPAWVVGRYLGIKTVNVFPANAACGLPALHAVYTLFDASTGVPLAQMDGGEITTRRTAAASALAASMLARADARRLLIVGAGRVASVMPEAMRVVRPALSRVDVCNRSAPATQALVEQLNEQGFDAHVVTDLEDAVAQADIVSCATLSIAPLIQGTWLRPGTHVDLVGSFTPQMRESDGACLQRSRVFVDTEEALAKSGDVLQAVAEGMFHVDALQGTLARLCRGERDGGEQGGCRVGRRDASEITLFKSVGTALEDLAAAELVFAHR